jgi:hypothetical protein
MIGNMAVSISQSPLRFSPKMFAASLGENRTSYTSGSMNVVSIVGMPAFGVVISDGWASMPRR